MSGDPDRPYQGAFVGRVHHFALRAYFEDTDVSGVVYHANYLKYMERARSDMLRALGIEQRKELESGEGVYAVTAVSIRYHSPARLDDDLLIISEVQQVRGASCLIQQRVMRGRELLTEASVTVAFLSPDGRPRRQPRAWVEKFEQVTKREANDQ
jgi:acyl-CoA thioester hydrolase